uniref:(northern house mosquito) hypothetical protein n=1 Tax=Culex pipiens TaxID=7175 RepID=A0A8D8HBB8_CULPI
MFQQFGSGRSNDTAEPPSVLQVQLAQIRPVILDETPRQGGVIVHREERQTSQRREPLQDAPYDGVVNFRHREQFEMAHVRTESEQVQEERPRQVAFVDFEGLHGVEGLGERSEAVGRAGFQVG